jgi:hypothetical protein
MKVVLNMRQLFVTGLLVRWIVSSSLFLGVQLYAATEINMPEKTVTLDRGHSDADRGGRDRQKERCYKGIYGPCS